MTEPKSTADIDPDMRLLHDKELDAVFGGVSGERCFHFPAVPSLLTTGVGDPTTAAILTSV
jgi:hypothetical protein